MEHPTARTVPHPPTAAPGAGWPPPPAATPGPPAAHAPGGTDWRQPPPSVGPPAPAKPGSSGARRAGWTALAAIAVFASGAGGVLVGTELADEPEAAPPPAEGAVTPTVTGPAPATAAEPVAAVAASLSPSVVQIETRTGLGSGFVYDADGLVMTAAHVVAGSTEVNVRLADGTTADGTVLGADPNTDVAVVRVEGRDDLTVAPLALGSDLQVGQTAVAIGSPFGLDQSVTAGIVSAIGRPTQTPGRNGVPRAIPAIQTDAPINTGNSGGALADIQGRVIGVNSSIITADRSSSGNVGVGFAVPIDIAKAVADRIVAGQSIDSGYMGVSSADVTGPVPGAEIVQIQPGSPADDAGLRVGDVITAFDGRQMTSAIDLVAAVTPREPGDDVVLDVVRGDEEITVEMTLGTTPN